MTSDNNQGSVWSLSRSGQAFDCVLTDIKARPEIWKMAAAQGCQREDAGAAALGSVAWEEAWQQSLNTVTDNHTLSFETVSATMQAVSDIARGSLWAVARDAGIALLAWPTGPDILAADPPAVRMWAALGQPAAVLLLPACIALHTDHAKSHSFWSQISG